MDEIVSVDVSFIGSGCPYQTTAARPPTSTTKVTMTTRSTIALLLLLLAASYAMPLHAAGDTTPLGIALEGYPYPHPVRFHPVSYFGDDLRMAYMDVPPPANANGTQHKRRRGAGGPSHLLHQTRSPLGSLNR